MTNATMIIETSANQFFAVRNTNDDDLPHVWFGTEVKRVKGAYVPKARAREILVRKAATRFVSMFVGYAIPYYVSTSF